MCLSSIPKIRWRQPPAQAIITFEMTLGHANAAGNDLIGQWVFEIFAGSILPGSIEASKRDSTLVLLTLNERSGLEQCHLMSLNWFLLWMGARQMAPVNSWLNGISLYLTNPLPEGGCAGLLQRYLIPNEWSIILRMEMKTQPILCALMIGLLGVQILAIASLLAKGAVNEEGGLIRPRKSINEWLSALAKLIVEQSGPMSQTPSMSLRTVELLFASMQTTVKRFPIEYQISIRAMRRGWKIAEIPTVEGQRIGGESKALSWPVGKDHLEFC